MKTNINFNLQLDGSGNDLEDYRKGAAILRVMYRNLDDQLFRIAKFSLTTKVDLGDVDGACNDVRKHAPLMIQNGFRNRVEELADLLMEKAERKEKEGEWADSLTLYRAAACVSCLHLKDQTRTGQAALRGFELAQRAFTGFVMPREAFMAAQTVQDYGPNTVCEPLVPMATKIIHATWPELNRK